MVSTRRRLRTRRSSETHASASPRYLNRPSDSEQEDIREVVCVLGKKDNEYRLKVEDYEGRKVRVPGGLQKHVINYMTSRNLQRVKVGFEAVLDQKGVWQVTKVVEIASAT